MGVSRRVAAHGGMHALVLSILSDEDAASPLAASALVLGALGVVPRGCFGGCRVRASRGLRCLAALVRSPRARVRSSVTAHGPHAAIGQVAAAATMVPPPLALTALSLALLAAYVAAVRLGRAPVTTAGPFLAPCARGRPTDLATSHTTTEAPWSFEWVHLGSQWTMLGLMYGSRAVAVPPLCASDGNGSGGGTATGGGDGGDGGDGSHGEPHGTVGLVFAADGSQRKYAHAVYVALHNLRTLQHSELPAEVMHVGVTEQFAPQSASQLRALGGVQLVDLLQRLHPSIRQEAACRLRSFAVKPFALLAASFETAILLDANALFFAPPERLLSLASYQATGVQLFNDYVRAYHVLDPWLVASYVGRGAVDVEAYRRITQGAEIDSSVVVADRRRAWRYLHVVCALNWWKAIVDRHAWGDKDTWALGAIALQPGGGGDAYAGSVGSRVGWLARTAVQPPSPVWGHVQFDATRDAANASALLYMNWQPHYAAGFIELADGDGAAATGISCCVMLQHHWAGPHDEEPLSPTIAAAAHDRALRRTFDDARDSLRLVGSEAPAKPHWSGQVRYRRCAIYFAVLGVGVCFAAHAAWTALHAGGAERPRRS